MVMQLITMLGDAENKSDRVGLSWTGVFLVETEFLLGLKELV